MKSVAVGSSCILQYEEMGSAAWRSGLDFMSLGPHEVSKQMKNKKQKKHLTLTKHPSATGHKKEVSVWIWIAL